MAYGRKMTNADKVTTGLVVVGAVNWGLVGVANFDLVQLLANAVNSGILANIIYTAVGLSGLYVIYRLLG